MSGKTTIVEALVRAGATYYSDEFAVLDKSGHVHPYPVPLSIRVLPTSPASGHRLNRWAALNPFRSA